MAVNQIEFVGSILVGCSTCSNFLLIHVAVPVNVNTESVRGMGRIQMVLGQLPLTTSYTE